MENQDYPLPVGPNSERSAKNLLPRYFRTDTNNKFIQSTVDAMISEGVVEKLDSFVGRRNSPTTTVNDTFLPDTSPDRENYQLEPSLVYKDDLGNVDFFATYPDYMNMLKTFKGSTLNHSTINSQQSYSWDPHVNWDKFTNFREYYWLPLGPDPIAIAGNQRDVVSVYTVSLGTDDQTNTYVFSPDGLTKNPTLKLYKGQTYYFDIDTPGHPMAIVTNIAFDDNDPLFEVDAENISTVYNDGIKRFKRNSDGAFIETNDVWIESGRIEFTPDEEVPAQLFYVSQNGPNLNGIMAFYSIGENTEIDIDADILGKKFYRTSEGLVLSNGMKVYFQGDVTPAKYAQGYYFVQGVGKAIYLVPEIELDVPVAFTGVEKVPFDGEGFAFDQYPFEDAASFQSIKDYVCIDRGSPDRNPWARYNRWFHKDVIEQSFLANGLPVAFDENARAKRPIIEYTAGLKLFNHGLVAKANVDLIDTFTPDVFSTIEGSGGYIIDGVDVTDGMRILFTGDSDILVYGKIYQVKFILWGTGATKNRQITLIETEDTLPSDGDCVLVKLGDVNAGKMFHFEDTRWKAAQEKTKVNEHPHFDLCDGNGYSYGNTTQYPGTSFTGTKLFSYAQGSGSNDPELGFPLKYESISNFGDILFDFNYYTDKFTYQDADQNVIESKVDTGFFKIVKSDKSFDYKNVWTKTYFASRQPVIRQYNGQLNNFDVDVFDNSHLLDDLVVRVYVNNKKQKQDVDYVLENGVNYKRVRFLQNLSSESIVVLKCYSEADKNINGYYEIPKNLESNPQNQDLVSFTLGEVNKHVNSMVENLHPFATGTVPGNTNLRDLPTASRYGTVFMKHSGPLALAGYHFVDKNANIVKSLQFAMNEYSKFKRAFLYEAGNTGFHGDVRKHVDLIMNKITADKKSSNAFFASDMVPMNASTVTTHTIDYDETTYLPTSFTGYSLDKLSKNAVLVYVNEEQKYHNVDYTFENGFIKYLNPTVGQDIVVYEYENTNGCYVPPTPTKLGLYPLYKPEFQTITGATGTVDVVVGHDGSYTKRYNDYRDDLLLDLEMRIYNNIKMSYDTDSLDIHNFIGGKWRNTGVARETIDGLLLEDFATWANIAGNPNYTDNTNWTGENSFTFNYRNMSDSDGNRLPGGWRAIFKQFYDTDRPHTHPWEMLGFSIEPTWWQSVYGPAPYTFSNTVLWQDLRDGFVKEPGKALVQKKNYIRPDLLSIIPVDDNGNLRSPLDSGIAKGFYLPDTSEPFVYGDQGPVESAFRNSSDYRFSILKAWVISQPCKMFGLGFDKSRTKLDLAGNYVYTETNKQIDTANLVFPTLTGEDENSILTAGLVNYIANYVKWTVSSSYDTYKTQLANLSTQLSIKLAGFAEKQKLKLLLDSRSPLNTTSVFVPDENYQIFLNTSSVQDVAVLSGILITVSEAGYIVQGYDTGNPSFTIYPYTKQDSDIAINVGGISEKFVNWASDNVYSIGTIVRYNGVFYRAKISHTSGDEFEPNNFAKLAELPVQGGKDAVIRRAFSDTPVDIPYGQIYTNEQDVVDFLLGYEAYLKAQGWSFDNINPESGKVEDMLLLVKEFLFFTTQNWDNDTVLAISPAANKVVFSRKYYTIDNIYDNFYDINILDGNGNTLTGDLANIYRDRDTNFTINPVGTSEGIFLIKLPLVQKEHVVLLDNKTVFSDTIYDRAAGFRQERIKLVGYRTDNWSGSLSIPGFFYDEAKIVAWTPNTDYVLGAIVKYKEFYYSAYSNHSSKEKFDDTKWRRLNEKPVSQIYPNWDYKVNQFADFYDLDTDNFDVEQQKLAQHLIGYQKRNYLENIITDSVSQYKFYQGFIAEKGSNNSITKLFDALGSADKDSIELYEEWAVRTGQFGSIDNVEELEFEIKESKYRLEPQIFELNNSFTIDRTDLVYEITPNEVYKSPTDYNHTIVNTKTGIETFTKNSGYVRSQDVEYIVNTMDNILNINIDNLEIGKHIWVTTNKQDWTVLKHSRSNLEITGFENTTLDTGLPGVILDCDIQIDDIAKDDIVGIFSSIPNLKGFFKVTNVLGSKITIDLNNPEAEISFEDDDDSFTAAGGASLSVFVTRRFADTETLNATVKDIQKNSSDRLWLDDTGTGTFGVYENDSIASLQQEYLGPDYTTVSVYVDGDVTSAAGPFVGEESDDSSANTIYFAQYHADINRTELVVDADDKWVVGATIRASDSTNLGEVKHVKVESIQSHDSNFGNTTVVKGFDRPAQTTGDQRGGFVVVEQRNAESFGLVSRQEILAGEEADRASGFGTSVAISPDSKFIAIGAPLADNFVSRLRGTYDPTEVYDQGDIVIDRDTLWRARVAVSNYYDNASDSSTISDNDDSYWEPVYLLEYNGLGTASTLTNQGMVYIYEFDNNARTYVLQVAMSSPDPLSNEKFGNQVELRKDLQGRYQLSVAAPGVSEQRYRIYFFEYDPLDPQWKWTRNRNYKGVFDVDEKYRTGDIVFYSGALYQALVERLPATTPITDKLPTDTNSWTPVSDIEHTGYLPNRLQDLDGDLDTGESQFGVKFDVNDNGDKIIVESEVAGKRTLSIYHKPASRWEYIQELQGDENKRESWGIDFAINDQGDTIAVSAPLNDDNALDAGTVYVYKQGTNNQFTLQQNVRSPFNELNEAFGSAVDFSGNKLAICGKNTDLVENTTFDARALVFDNGNTKISRTIQNTGRIILFELINDVYVYAEDIEYKRDTSAHILDDFKFNQNHLYLNIPSLVANDTPDPNNTKYITGVRPGLFVDFSFTKNKNTWSLLTQQVSKPDIEELQQVFLYSKDTQDIIQRLDVIDPRQGKIAGPAEQEISYKTWYDPAVYSFSTGDNAVTVDANSNWTERYVGKVWWNISKASWFNPYQGDSNFRSNVFHQLLPNATIEVCEWVSSELTPNEWDELSGTTQGYARGVSGTTLYGANAFSSKQVYDTVKKSFSTRYYYWVRNAQIIPNVNGRVISCESISSLISNPANTGYRFISLLENNKFTLYNCESLIEDTNSVLHFRRVKDKDVNVPIHYEYDLLTEGLDLSMPSSAVEQKWIDSLIGYDVVGNPLPDPQLQPAMRYGILNEPRQTMFVNRIEAVKQFVDRVNSVFKEKLIVDNYDISKLLRVDPMPLLAEGKWDVKVDTPDDLQFVGTAKKRQAVLTPVITDGRITDITIVDSGAGYVSAPELVFDDATGKNADIVATINSAGNITSVTVKDSGFDYSNNTVLKVRPFSVLVESDNDIGGRWAIFVYNSSQRIWERVDNQAFDTTKYWNYADWYASGYSVNTVINQTVDYSYELFSLDNNIGDIVKIKNIGTGGWLLLRKTANVDSEDYTLSYETIGRENGTIQLSELIYNYTTKTTGYDASVYDIGFYDREPVNELRNIVEAIQSDLFTGDLTVEYNKAFFASIRYVLAEQPNVDWVFKSSFVKAKHNVGELIQKVAYQNDNLENYQDYINEVKPYKTDVREYISSYQRTEPTNSVITDFDLPPSYIGGVIQPSVAKFTNNEVTNLWEKYFTNPYKNWTDNNTYEILRIEISDGGSGFKASPQVFVSGDSGATARAYVARGKVTRIEVLNPGNRVYSAPTITVSGNQDPDGLPVKASVIIGNPLARSTHMTMKFDRVTGKKYFDTIDKTETFVGTGAKQKFMLKWPMNIKTDKYTVKLNGVELLKSEYTVGNDLDTTKGYDRYLGYINFDVDPVIDAAIEVSYKKDTALLNAADRILYEYSPTTGMPGKELAQLMTGVEYEGALYQGFDFANEQGFGVGGFSDLPWDTFDNTYDDEIIQLDGSTSIIELSAPLEDGVSYNIYQNGVRLDDPAYDGSTVTANKNAVMATIVGDGVTTEINIEGIFTTTDGDEIIVRKEASDGSFSPVGSSFDVSLSGGALDRTTATGIASGEIAVDGDGFFTEANSGGPEELVPGTLTDTLDLQVYTRQNDGLASIAVANYVFDGSTRQFDFPEKPYGEDNVVVLVNNKILQPSVYESIWDQNAVFIDSDEDLEINDSVTVMTFGANGTNLIDSKTITLTAYDINNRPEGNWRFVTACDYSSDVSAIVMFNGVLQTEGDGYFLQISDSTTEAGNKVVIEFPQGNSFLDEGNVIQYAVYDTALQSYSSIYNDYSWQYGDGNYWNFTNTPTPFNIPPLGHNLLVFADDRILSPGYTIRYTTTSDRAYDIDGWQFEDITSVASVDILVFVDDVRLDKQFWAWDQVNARINLLSNSVATAGSKLDIVVLKNAEYYFIDTQVTFTETDGSTAINMESRVTVGQPLKLTSTASSTTFQPIVKSVSNNVVVLESMQSELRDEFVVDEDFWVSDDSTVMKIAEIEFIDSDSISIEPTIYDDLLTTYRVTHFSNHDVNKFRRFTYDVLTSTVVNENTDEYIRRNLLTNGIIQLESPPAGAQYVWVFKNQRILQPLLDYEVMEEMDAVRLNDPVFENDRIDVLHWANTVSSNKFGYRIFRDMLGRTHYKRLNQENSYMLTQDLKPYDTKIVLQDATGIQTPNINTNLPGILWIDGERIEYFSVSGNTLTQLRRGTLGTGVKDVHPAGERAYGQGSAESVNYQDTIEVYKDQADGSSQVVDLGFTFDNINEIEVFVGGRKLSKSAIEVYNKTLEQDSTEGDETVEKEFDVVDVSGVKTIQFTTAPAAGTEVRVVKKTGSLWISSGETLRTSSSPIARFLRGATIELPK